MSVDNFEQIKELLEWNSKDEFYFLQILMRKKDAKKGMKVNGTNNNSRLIKAYYIKNLDYFDFIKPEVIELCKLFNARASINLNKRSFEKTALQNLKLITDNIINKNYDKVHKTYTSACGKFQHDSQKKWIVDIDEEEMPFLNEIRHVIGLCDPDKGTSKIVAEIPSKSGLHLITTPFNKKQFKDLLDNVLEKYRLKLSISLQTNNPTNLFIP